jgi:hypothetical protein
MTTQVGAVESAALVRQERLSQRVSSLRRRFSLGDRWLLVVGGLLLPLGIMLVVLGWEGASNTVFVWEQLPYLISGGLLGLALVFAGGFLYFAYWLTLLVRENREGRAQLAAVLGRVEMLLSEGGPRTHRTAAAATLVATRTGTMLHRPDCVAVDGKADLRSVTEDQPGLTPCKLCDPLG